MQNMDQKYSVSIKRDDIKKFRDYFFLYEFFYLSMFTHYNLKHIQLSH